MRLRLLFTLMIVGAVALAATTLPVGASLAALRGRVEGLGVWGPLVVGGVYVLATVLFVPGSAITLAIGALFGPLLGTVVVSLSSTTGAALAFLIARFAGRRRLSAIVAGDRTLDALDRAVTAEGWKIVALVRLSPLVPFNLQNYLWGLTGIRFWPCVLASWIAMLPGTFLFVYLGYLGGAGIESAAGAEQAGVAVWALRGLGLAATVVVTILLARRARQVLARADLAAATRDTTPASRPAVTAALGVLAVVALGTAVWIRVDPGPVRRAIGGLLGPPAVVMVERHERRDGGPDVDHAPLDRLLHRHVDDEGLVDYTGLAAESAELDAYLATLADAPLDQMGRDQLLATLINAYNVFTLRLILDHGGDALGSIREIDAPWSDPRWQLGGKNVSLDVIEHELIRPNFIEPRIHFAVVCAAIGCPPLRREAYAADRLEAQLADQARLVHASPRWFELDEDAGVVRLTPLYRWYRGDFEQAAGSMLGFAERYAPRLAALRAEGTEAAAQWLVYDWSLNRQP